MFIHVHELEAHAQLYKVCVRYKCISYPVQYSIAILHGFALLTQSWESPTGRLQASSTSVLTANVRSHEYFRTVFCWSWQVTHLVREGRRYPEVGALDISRCFAVDSNNWRKGRYLASICWSYIILQSYGDENFSRKISRVVVPTIIDILRFPCDHSKYIRLNRKWDNDWPRKSVIPPPLKAVGVHQGIIKIWNKSWSTKSHLG